MRIDLEEPEFETPALFETPANLPRLTARVSRYGVRVGWHRNTKGERLYVSLSGLALRRLGWRVGSICQIMFGLCSRAQWIAIDPVAHPNEWTATLLRSSKNGTGGSLSYGRPIIDTGARILDGVKTMSSRCVPHEVVSVPMPTPEPGVEWPDLGRQLLVKMPDWYTRKQGGADV